MNTLSDVGRRWKQGKQIEVSEHDHHKNEYYIFTPKLQDEQGLWSLASSLSALNTGTKIGFEEHLATEKIMLDVSGRQFQINKVAQMSYLRDDTSRLDPEYLEDNMEYFSDAYASHVCEGVDLRDSDSSTLDGKNSERDAQKLRKLLEQGEVPEPLVERIADRVADQIVTKFNNEVGGDIELDHTLFVEDLKQMMTVDAD